MNKLQVADQNQYQSNYFSIEFLGHVAHVKLNRPEKRKERQINETQWKIDKWEQDKHK